jgi:hypothetical protein
MCTAGLLLLGINFAPRVVVGATASALADVTVDAMPPALEAPAPAASADATPEPVAAKASAQPAPPARPSASRVDVDQRPAKRTAAPAAAVATPPSPVIDPAQLQRSISSVVDLDAQRYAKERAGEPLFGTGTTQARFEQGVTQARVERSARHDKIMRRVVWPALGRIPL